MRLVALAAAASLCATGVAGADQKLLLRQPALSESHLAFVYAGDIWVADPDGARPRRLTSHPAEEGAPVFSPDGESIAFVGNYESNRDVYVVPVAGGQPRRLTFHPGNDTPTGWTADGREVTFVSARETDHGRSAQLYHVSLDGGLPEKRMAARVYRGRYNADDSLFAYIPFGSGYNGLFGGTSGWKGYRGGTTPPVMIMDMDAQSVVTVPGADATNFNPFWLGERLYFLSDRDDELSNLFRYEADGSGQVTRVTNESLWEVRSADGHGETLVYEAGGRLFRLDTGDGEAREIVIDIDPDLPQLRPAWKDASDTIQSVALSPGGKRAIVTARGDVYTVPVEDGSTRNLTASDGLREYAGLWSPEGTEVAYIEESLDGQSLVIEEQDGLAEGRRFELGPHFYSLIDWSAGERSRIAFADNHLSLYTIDTASGAIDRIATGARRDDIDAAFSPDGRWLAYTRERPNYHGQIMLRELDGGRDIVVSDGDADATSPAFSRDGQYLYFAASTNSGPGQVGLNMSSRERPYRAGLYAAVLAADADSPLAPRLGDEDTDDADDGNDDDEGDEAEDDDAPVTEVDAEGLRDRIVALPVPEANYRSLAAADDDRLYYIDAVQAGAANLLPGASSADRNVLRRFDFEEREAEEVLDGVAGFGLSAGGSHLFVEKPGGSIAIGEIGDDVDVDTLDTSAVRARIDPRAEWGQIFDEAWRMEKEYFYDPGMHGLDWDAVYERYRPLVDHVGRREDLNDLIVEMIAELQVGHNRISDGDVNREEKTKTGLLGANFAIENDRYRITRVYTGETWNPFIDAPLATPGNSASAGDYLLAVNGRSLTAGDNLFEWLQGTAGAQVALLVGPRADGRDAREIVVEPVDDESSMRLWGWVEDNRRYVDDATEGRVGYVYLPNTGRDGFDFFNRMFYAQVDKDAIIFDERSNSGGQAANYIVEVLSRRFLSGWKDRDGSEFFTPAGAVYGPKLMMIDQDAGSGGDFLPYAFRELGIGKLLGTRTWGGLIGISANPGTIDGGRLVVPFFRFFDVDGEWTIENEGVAPDIEVRLDPVLTNAGRDSQLERAVEEIEAELERADGGVPTVAPPFPTELGE